MGSVSYVIIPDGGGREPFDDCESSLQDIIVNRKTERKAEMK